MGRDVVPPVPQVEADLEGDGVAVDHQPDGRGDLGARGAEPEVEDAAEDAQEPVDGRHRVVDEHQGVVEEAARRGAEGRLPVLLDDRLVRAPGPAELLGEEVRPGGRALADREDVGGVDGAPVVAGARVLPAVQFEAGGHVLGDRVVQAADLLEGGDPDDVVRADEHGRVITVPGALDEGVEEELLGLGGLGDDVGVVAVHLRSDDEGDVGVAEVAEHPLQEVGERDVVGVHGGEVVVVVAVHGEPGVVVAVLGPRPVDALPAVPLGDSRRG